MNKLTSIKKSEKSGLAPGSLVYVGDELAQETRISVINYDSKNLSVIEVATLKECVAAKNQRAVTWINIVGLHDSKEIDEIGKGYGLHPLILEDIFNTEQRPKIDMFTDYVFMLMRLYAYSESKKAFSAQQISLILGKNFVITFQEKPTAIFSKVRERLKHPQNLVRIKGADYLAHALLDAIVDSYFKIIEEIGDHIEELEESLTNHPKQALVKEIHDLRREILFLRKSVWPLRELISSLQSRVGNLIQSDTMLYFKDIHDHTVQVIDTVETYRDLLGGMLEIYLSSVSNHLNEIMKVLTVFASIFIPLTFIVGLYGMNFNPAKSPYNMPELDWYYGYPYALGIMLVVVIMMLWFFKRKKWW